MSPKRVLYHNYIIQYNTIQYNNHLVKRSLIETPLRERPYSSLAASLNEKKEILKNYIVQTWDLETKFLIYLGKLL